MLALRYLKGESKPAQVSTMFERPNKVGKFSYLLKLEGS